MDLEQEYTEETGRVSYDKINCEYNTRYVDWLEEKIEQLRLNASSLQLKEKEPPHYYDWLKENKVDFFANLILYKGDWLNISELYIKYKKEFNIPL